MTPPCPMNGDIEWQYNEFLHVGTDYSRPDEVEKYEARHSNFRDIESDSNTILDSLGITTNDVLIDFGCGTGIFAIQAAHRCAWVHAVDVSHAMLEYAKSKAEKAGITNIDFHHGGFLTFKHDGSPADHITTTFAFHHLPDFWKGIALKRLHGMLRPSGRFFLHDVIIKEERAVENIEVLIEKLGRAGGSHMRNDAKDHFSKEYSTYDWIMDGMLVRAGFTINSRVIEDGVIATYHCTRQP